MTRRILTIVLAIALAVIGTGAVLLYAKGADQRAIAGQKAISVLVAAQQIPAGTVATTALADGMLARQKLPASSVPADAVRSLTSDLKPLVASANIAPGELLLRPMLVTAVAATSGVAIPSGMMAVTIAMCVPEAVARYVYPGAEVAVFDTYVKSGSLNAQWTCGSKSLEANDKTKIVTRIVLTRVKVLSVAEAAPVSAAGGVTSTAFGQANSGTADQATQNQVLVTLAVDQSDAERVINLAESGLPYMALLTTSSVTGSDGPTLPLFPPTK
ncbi:MAG TPA: RcpC/CpaB family pilus assembly protein [Streptosporangiaceae bacterium]|nr:RcpC/CpaB family pilus assembly protein [Streptosporangiaceae bacterium]